MKCPVDGSTLSMTDRNGVEIDFCPSCRGVWLDRGELDKIIAAAAPQVAAAVHDQRRDARDLRDRPRGDDRDGRPWRDDDDDDRHRGRRKRESFLSDLFDF